MAEEEPNAIEVEGQENENVPAPGVTRGTFTIYLSSVWCIAGFGSAVVLILPLSYIAPRTIERFVSFLDEHCRKMIIISSLISLCGVGLTYDTTPQHTLQDKMIIVETTAHENEVVDGIPLSILDALVVPNIVRRFGVGMWTGLALFGLVKMIK